jgi:hypothetical protein
VHAVMSFLLVLLAQTTGLTLDPQSKAQAQVLLTEGTALYAHGDFGGALAKFESAYGVYPSSKLLFDIAKAHYVLGHLVEAAQIFERFVALTPDSAPDILAEARQSISELQTKLGQIRIQCDRSNIQVMLDGTAVGATPLLQPLWAAPGRHQISMQHEGYATAGVTIASGETSTIVFTSGGDVVPRALPTSSPAATAAGPLVFSSAGSGQVPARDGWWSRQKWYVWASAGGLLAFTTAATVVSLSANSRFNGLQSTCGVDRTCTDSQVDTVRSRATAANVLWGLAGASAIATGVSVYLSNRENVAFVAWRF